MTVRRVVLVAACLMFTQLVISLVRPMTSYRLLGLGEGAATIGWLTAVFAVAPLLLALPMGRWAGGRALRRLGLGGCMAVALACVGLALATEIWHFVLSSVVLGSGNLAQLVAYQSVIAGESEDSTFDQNYGWMSAGSSLGQLIGPVLGALVLQSHASAVTGTSLALGVGALAGVAGLVCSTRLLRPVHSPHRPSRVARVPTRSLVGGTLKQPGAKASLYVSLVGLAATDLFQVYLPVLGEERGLAPMFVGVLLGIRAAASLVSRLFLGQLVRRYSRRLILLWTASAAGVLMFALVVPLDAVLLVVLMVAIGLALGTEQPVSLAWSVSAVAPEQRATAIVLRLMGNRLGQVLLPGAAAVFAAAGGVAAVFVMLGALLVSSAGAVAASTDPYKD